jgi:hypothetical protein
MLISKPNPSSGAFFSLSICQQIIIDFGHQLASSRILRVCR